MRNKKNYPLIIIKYPHLSRALLKYALFEPDNYSLLFHFIKYLTILLLKTHTINLVKFVYGIEKKTRQNKIFQCGSDTIVGVSQSDWFPKMSNGFLELLGELEQQQ